MNGEYRISKDKIAEMVDHVKKYPPYTKSDPEYYQFDGKYDEKKMWSTFLLKSLKKLGIDIETFT